MSSKIGITSFFKVRATRRVVRLVISGVALAVLPIAEASDSNISPFVAHRLEDPINWKQWNEGTLDKITEDSRPVLLSISNELNALSFAMAKESFRNKDIAAETNYGLFPISVDKNEYPILAEFWQLFAKSSKEVEGYPLTVVMSPALSPIDGGGYYPPTDDWGSQGLYTVVSAVHEQWSNDAKLVEIKASDKLEELSIRYGKESSLIPYEDEFLEVAVENLINRFDFANGGFSMAPKSVDFETLSFIYQYIQTHEGEGAQAKRMYDMTLAGIMNGGMRDFVRGGFYSWSTDDLWVVPDYRKSAITQLGAIEFFSQIGEDSVSTDDIAQSLKNNFQLPNGLYSEYSIVLTVPGKLAEEIASGVASAWSYQSIKDALETDEFSIFASHFDIKEDGNVAADLDPIGHYKGLNVLKIQDGEMKSDELDSIRRSLAMLKAESENIHFVQQSSISNVCLNAAVVSTFSKLGGEHLVEAKGLAEKLLNTLYEQGSKMLYASVQGERLSGGESSSRGYAYLIQACLDLAEATDDRSYLDKAIELQDRLDSRFLAENGLYMIGPKDSTLIPENLYAFNEGEYASANTIQVANLNRLANALEDESYRSKAESIISQLPEEISYASEQYIALLSAISVFRGE